MKNRKFRFFTRLLTVWMILAVWMLTAAACQPAETPPEETTEETVTAQETEAPKPMFTDYGDAVAQLKSLSDKYINPNIVGEDSYNAFTALVEEAAILMAEKDPDAAKTCELAENLTNAYNSIEYLKGDTPRVYLNTISGTPNYAEGRRITASSEASEEQSAAKAVDGDSKTAWQSDGNAEQTLEIDLGMTREIGYICFEWGKGAAKRFEVDVSEDGENWEILKVFEDGAKYKTQGYELDKKVRGRYIRVHIFSEAALPYVLEEITVSIRKPDRATGFSMEYKDANVVIVDREGGKYPTIAEKVQVKIRGNSTANKDKNPYNIKFESKTKILGMKGSKKWSLLANLFDKTLIRNKLAYDFAAIAGVKGLESTFVEVYLDGSYEGCYLLTMPVTDGTVDIDVEKGEMLFERNGYYNLDAAGKNYNYTPVQGIRFVPIDPAKGTETEEQKEFIKDLLAKVEYACIDGDRERLEKIIDIDSFVNMYVCEELMKDIDIFHGSTYFYYKNGLFYSGPIWDMDLSMGNVSISYSRAEEKYAKYHNVEHNGRRFGDGKFGDSTTGVWAQVDFYGLLMEHDWFRELVKERYTELIPAIENMYSEGGMIDGYVAEYGDAFIRNYEEGGYSFTQKYFDCEYDTPFKSYDDSVKFLKGWLRERDAWVRSYLGIE